MPTVIILNYNDYASTEKLIRIIHDYQSIEHIVVVDNCSTDNSYAKLRELGMIKVDVIRSNYNGGYGVGNNIGITYASERYNAKSILIANPDIYFAESTLKKLESVLFDMNAGIVSAVMTNPRGERSKFFAWKTPSIPQYMFTSSIFHKFHERIWGTYKYDESYLKSNQLIQVDCVPGSMLLVDSEKMLKYGMYDEKIFLYCEETALGIKLKNNGIKTYLVTSAEFYHYHSVSINRTYKSEISRERLMWNSRMYVLKHYLNANRIQLLLVRLYSKFNLIERIIFRFIRDRRAH